MRKVADSRSYLFPSFFRCLRFGCFCRSVNRSGYGGRGDRKPPNILLRTICVDEYILLFRQECGIGHIAHDHAFVEHLVGEYPVFFEYGAVVTQCPPLFETAQGMIDPFRKIHDELFHPADSLSVASSDRCNSFMR